MWWGVRRRRCRGTLRSLGPPSWPCFAPSARRGATPLRTPYLRRRRVAERVRQRVASAVRWTGLGVTGAGAPPVLGSSRGTIETPPAWVPPVTATLPELAPP